MKQPETRGNTAIFHGWWIVLTAFLCHAINVGLMFYAWGVFLTPLAETFGGRGRVALAYTCTQLAQAAYGLVVGRVVDRHGARGVEIAGACLLAAGFALLSQVGSLPLLYLCMAGPIALGSTCMGALPNNAVVARWFVRRRGQALGIATAGISAGGIVMAPLAQWLIVHRGWREAYLVLAALVLVVVLPPVLAFMRRDPADLGLLPDGEPAPRGAGHAALEAVERELERSVRPEVAVRSAAFWLLAVCFGLTMAGLAGVLLFQIPLLIDRGMDPTHASLVLGATAAMGVVGKLGFGALLDRYDQRRVAAACFLLQGAGVLLLWATHSTPGLVAYVILYGYAMGGNATLQASLVAEAFGRVHYGAISGRLVPFIVLAQAAVIPAMASLRDHTGSFGPALGVVIAASVVATVLVLRIRLPGRERLARAA
ncbi:MAG: MFS transporter [bacterium]|nr:MFS transporter [bacterium]